MTRARLVMALAVLGALLGIPRASATPSPMTTVWAGTYLDLDLTSGWSPRQGGYDLTGVTHGWLGVSVVRVTTATYTPYLQPSLLRIAADTYCSPAQCPNAGPLALDEPGEPGHDAIRPGRYVVMVLGTSGTMGVLHLGGFQGRLGRSHPSPAGADIHTFLGS